MKLSQVEEEIVQMNSGEKVYLLKILVEDLSKNFPGIEKNENIAGGSACIVRTRIPVWSLEYSRRIGLSEAQLLFDYPTLRAVDLVNSWSYVALNKSEINREILENIEA